MGNTKMTLVRCMMSLKRSMNFASCLVRCRGGALSVEASIVMLPFLLLTAMTLEVVLIEFFQASFDRAVYDTGRMIRTGGEASDDSTAGNNTEALEIGHLVQDICTDAGNWKTAPFPNCYNYSTSTNPNSTTNIAIVLTADTTANLPNAQAGISGGALVASQICNATSSSSETCGTMANFPAACNVVMLQAFFRWPILIPLNYILNSGFSSPYAFLFSSTAVFEDEQIGNSNCTSLGS